MKEELDRFFSTNEFGGKSIFEYALDAESCICFTANEMLKAAFTEMVMPPGEYGEYQRKILVIRTILALADIKCRKSVDMQYFSGDSADKVHTARKILGENIATDISIEELAEKVSLNRTTLQKVFKEMYGVTIFEYRTQVRMQESKNLLLNKDMTIIEIAAACGYANASKYSAVFKKRFGVTPTEWRKMAPPE